VINLPARSDRRSEVDVQLQRAGVSLSDSAVTLFEAIRPADAGPFPSIGARGCFMSHLEVLRDADSKKCKNILILEDDANFAKGISAQLELLKGSLEELNWMLYYGGALNEFSGARASSKLWEVEKTSPLSGSHCIAVNREILPKIVRYLDAMLGRPAGSPEGGPMHIDGAYSWFRKDNPIARTFISVPALSFQRSSATDIHDRKWIDKQPFIGELARGVRRMKNNFMGWYR